MPKHFKNRRPTPQTFNVTGLFLVPVTPAPGVSPSLAQAEVTFPYIGLHTDAALEATRQAWNGLPLDGDNQRAHFTRLYGVVPHLSNLSLHDALGRTLRTVKGPLFEVIS